MPTTHVPFQDLLARADGDLLRTLLSRPAARLLSAIDERGVTSARLRATLLAQRSPYDLIVEHSARKELLDLLRPEEATELAMALGLSGDPFAALRAFKPRRRSRRLQLLLDFLCISTPDERDLLQQPPSRIVAEARYGLFQHQRDASQRIRRYFTRPDARVLLHMPTGSGKTRTAINVIVEHLRANEPTAVVWLATSEELCEQATQEFERAWRHLGDRPLPVHRFWGAHELGTERLSDAFVVAGLRKTHSAATTRPGRLASLGDATSLIVVDEAHQSIAATYRLVIDALFARRPGRSCLLGLTATPGRTWSDIDEDEKLASFFNHTKVALDVQDFQDPVEYLIKNDYLARPTFKNLEWYGELTPSEELELSDSLDVPPTLLRRLAEDEVRNVRVLRAVEDAARRHQRILLFAATVDHAILLSAVLQARGISARAITGTTPSTTRRASIAWFKDDDPTPKVLSNFGVLTTGFDAPRTSCAVIARPTLSLVLFSQMVGRATRGRRAGGNAEAEIITIVDTSLPGFRSIAESFSNWEDVWR